MCHSGFVSLCRFGTSGQSGKELSTAQPPICFSLFPPKPWTAWSFSSGASTSTGTVSHRHQQGQRIDINERGYDKQRAPFALCRAFIERLWALALMFASGHTATNTPDLFRTLKLTVAGPGQYWGGGPPGKPLGCC